MFSRLRPTCLYTDISPDVMEHDDDVDAEEWVYDGRTVLRGSPDPRYTDRNVYSLYDEDSNRVGLAEHERDDPSVFHALWFYPNPFATLLQEPEWKSAGQTIWSMLCPTAYQAALDCDFVNLPLACIDRVATIRHVQEGLPAVYECETCGTRSFSLEANGHTMKKRLVRPSLCMDESYVLHHPPPNSSVWIRLGLQPDGDETLQEQGSLLVQEEEGQQE
jgi:hypothetical protein